MVHEAAETTGLPEFVVKAIFEYLNETENLPQVLVASSNRGPDSPDNLVDYIPFDSSTTPEQIADTIGAGEFTRKGIQEVLEAGAKVWIMAGPDGFVVGGKPGKPSETGEWPGVQMNGPQINEAQSQAITKAACEEASQLFARDGLSAESLKFGFVLIRPDGRATLANSATYHLKYNVGYTSLLGVIGNCGDFMQWAVLDKSVPAGKKIMSEMTEEWAYELSPGAFCFHI